MHSALQTAQMHQWLDRMKAGDDRALDALLKAVAAPLERLARQMLRRFPRVARWSDAEDVVQNASLRLIRALREIRPDSMRDFYALAATQVRRELLDMTKSLYGKEGVGANHASVAAHPGDSAPVWDPAASTDDAHELDKWVRFHEEVERLPGEEREIVGLLFYHGLTQAEVAEMLEVSERTVQRRWQTAQHRLKSLVSDWATLG